MSYSGTIQIAQPVERCRRWRVDKSSAGAFWDMGRAQRARGANGCQYGDGLVGSMLG